MSDNNDKVKNKQKDQELEEIESLPFQLLLPHQAVGLGAPQTTIRRPLPLRKILGHAGCSCGHLGATPSPSTSTFDF